MLDATGKKLLRLLETDQPAPVRQACARVLIELGLRDSEVTRAVAAGLDDADPAVRALMLEAAGRLRVEPALTALLKRIEDGGAESELAAQAAARLGPRATKALQDLMGKVAPGLRRRIAGALAAAGTASAEGAAVEALTDRDPGVVDAAARSLSAEIPSFSDAQKKALADHLLGLLKPAGRGAAARTEATETAAVRLLAALGDPRAEAVLWDRVQPVHAVSTRAAALQGLSKLGVAPRKEQFQRLLACACDPDFRVAAPALMILRGLPVGPKQLAEWLMLLDAPDVAVRRAALDMLGDRDGPEVAAALLKQLAHPDRGLREQALTALGQRAAGRQALAEALLAAATPDEAWSLARSQERFVGQMEPAVREKVLAQALAWVEAGDRRADPLLHLARSADAAGVRDRLEERAAALKKKKQYDKSLVYYRLLTRDPACRAEVRLEAAACALKLSPKDLAQEARAADRCLEDFARLLHHHPEETLAYVQSSKALDPEDLFYLGFHFAERERQERDFGGEMLKLVVERAGRTKLGKDARAKLRGTGLE